MAGLVPAIHVFCHSHESGNPVTDDFAYLGEDREYWIAQIVKLVLGLAKPDPSAGQ
jgi:hypothetical protein